MAFSQARQFGGGVSRAPVAVVEPSRGAAGAPSGASLSGLPQGGSKANDIAGVLGLGGGMLGKFLYDKYKDDPEALKQLLGFGADIGGALLPSDNAGIQAGTLDQVASGMPAPADMSGAIGVDPSMIQPSAQPMDMSGGISNLASNFGAGVPAVADYQLQTPIFDYWRAIAGA